MEDIEANEGGDGTPPTLQTAGGSDGSGTNKKGNTTLHSAVLSVCREGNDDERFYRDIHDLMTNHLETLNKPNSEGHTAVGCAVQYSHKKCVEHMLQHDFTSFLYVDYYPGDSQLTLKKMITDRYPDLQPRLPKSKMESLGSPDINMKLLAALQHNKYDIFIEHFDDSDSNPWCGEPYYSTLLEIACQMKDRKGFVTVLLEKGADPNTTNRITGMPLLHATARSGNFEILEMLLEMEKVELTKKDTKGRTILHWLAQVRVGNERDTARLKNCFETILSQDVFAVGDLNQKDSSGETPFSISVKCEFMDRTIIFLEDDFHYFYQGQFVHSVLKSAEKSLLERILDSCLVCNDVPVDSEYLKVTFKLWPLVIMMYFARFAGTQNEELLKYPELSIFVNLFWKKVKYFFFLDVVFYILFTAFLTTYILYSEYYNTLNITSGIEDETKYNTSLAFRYVLMVLLGMLFVRELCQMLFDYKSYVMSKENWLEVLLIAVTFTSCSGLVESAVINRHFFAIAILLGWFELVLILGRLPVLSVQTEMLKRVSWTFLRFMAGYSVLVIAFAFSFYILFKESVGEGDAAFFDDPFISVLRTSVMFAGEFDVSDLPFDTLPGTSHAIFLLFVFFVAIVLLNLLNGLAVGDTRKITEKAEALSLAARVTIIVYIIEFYQRLLKRINFMEITQEMFILHPNISNKISSSDKESLQRIITEQRERSKNVQSTEHVENWKLFAEKLAKLELQTKEIREILTMILKSLGSPLPLNNVTDT